MKMIDRIMITAFMLATLIMHFENKGKFSKLEAKCKELEAVEDLHNTQFSAQGRVNELLFKLTTITAVDKTNVYWAPHIHTNLYR